jgi:putative ABC transport system permease protein
MRVLDRKIIRDLKRLWSQVIAIALVTATGTAVFVMSLGAMHSLAQTQSAYYERYYFADVFASVRRAPETLVDRLAAIPGVKQVSSRITHNVVLDIKGMSEPVNGLLSSLPEAGGLNQLHLRRGRLVLPASTREVVLTEAFAEARGLSLGDSLWATLKGRKRQLTIVGIALSPEYVFFGVPGAMVPDDERFGVLWMDRKALAAAFDLEGAFNDSVLSLMPGANEAEVLGHIDALLNPYGGVGAYGRSDHISHATLSGEIEQLRASIRIAAPLFIGVVAFLLHMLMMRHVETERQQIGTLKAFGYSNTVVAWHYLKFVLAIVAVGVTIGLIVGARAGHAITELYAASYRFPFLEYVLTATTFLQATAIPMAAALIGAMASLWEVIRLQPAVAMRSPPPPVYRHTLIERLVSHLLFDQPTRMILRHIVRWPLRSTLTILGIAAATAILVAPLGVLDSAVSMIDTHFFRAERQDMTVAFAQIRPHKAVYEIGHYSGVLQVEPFRATPAKIRHGLRSRRVTVIGREDLSELSRPLDEALQPMAIPNQGVVISSALAEWLGVGRGERVSITLLETNQEAHEMPVTAIAESYVGLTFFMVFMDRKLLNHLMQEGDVVTGTHLRLDSTRLEPLYADLKNTPAITGVVSHAASLAGMRRIMAQNLRLTMVNVVVAAIIIFGVVYNSARISLAERARELASMRLLGYSRLDVAYILLGELGCLTLAAIPIGCGLGYGFAYMLTEGTANEMFRLPLHLDRASFGYAALVALATVALSAAVVTRKIFRLDIVSILKTKE